MNGTGFTDIRPGQWITLLPAPWRHYAILMRLDRPIGTWLLLLPAWWALVLGGFDLTLMALFAAGAVIMRGAGCVVNDLWDRQIDRQVERTRQRPLASGALTVAQALLFLLMLLTLGLLILSLLNSLAIVTGLVVMGPVIVYPLMKRLTWWPQAFLGLTFNWGVLLGAAAAMGGFPPWAWPLYAAGVLWTLGYDTIYAHADIADDARVGVRSTARRLGENSRKWVAAFYLAAGIMLTLAGAAAGLGSGFYLVLAAVAGQVAHLVWSWRPDDPADCMACFRANRITGFLVLAAVIAGSLPA